ncbi:hypothetical protein Q7P37_009015 [Cladosporium fusiforme]
MTDPPPAKKSSGFSLYGDLLAPDKGGVISAGPVRYDMKPKEPEPEAQKKKNAAFQVAPVIKRPTQKKGKSKASSSSLVPRSSSITGAAGDTSSPDKQPPDSTLQQPAGGQVLSYSDFIGNVDEEEDEELYIDSRPKWQGRGGKKRKNKKVRGEEDYDEVNWDAIYDPSKPSNLARYQGSTEQDAERAEWTDFVHYHRDMAASDRKRENPKPRNIDMFAPPSGLSFAPPTFDEPPPDSTDPMDIDNDDEYYPPPASSEIPRSEYYPPPASFAPAAVPQDATGSDAYSRRLRLSGAPQPTKVHSTETLSGPTPPVISSSPVPPNQVMTGPPIDMAAKMAEAQARLAAVKAKIEAARVPGGNVPSPTPPQSSATPVALAPQQQSTDNGATISKAPVRYNLANEQIDALLDREEKAAQPTADSQSQSPAPDQPRSKMPGQKGFGARMMAKMGWEKGQGLGAKGEGITTALVAQTAKRKKRSDQDGGGWAAPRNMGKIVGGKKRNVQSTDDDEGQFGTISNVVKLQGMLDGMDVTYEIEEKDLMQEIGDEFSKSYGTIERLFVWREENGGNNEVFVKFTNQLSALKAVNGTDSMTFAGNPVQARFFDADKFESGEYA